MNWFFVALGAPILWALVIHIDKYLLSKYFRQRGVGALFIFSTLVSIIILPFFLLFEKTVFDIEFRSSVILILAGVLNSLGVLFYLHALEKGEASTIAPLFQITPLFSLFFAFSFLGEQLIFSQILGICAIVIGSILISINFSQKIRFEGKALTLMICASFSIASSAVLYKFVGRDVGFLVSSFWEYVGFLLTGIFFFLFVSSYRKQFTDMIGAKTFLITGLNLAGEMITLAGNLLVNFAFLLAPVALVSGVTSTQPFFVLLFGILLTVFFPNISKENIEKRTIVRKVCATVLIIFGSYLLYINL